MLSGYIVMSWMQITTNRDEKGRILDFSHKFLSSRGRIYIGILIERQVCMSERKEWVTQRAHFENWRAGQHNRDFIFFLMSFLFGFDFIFCLIGFLFVLIFIFGSFEWFFVLFLIEIERT